LYNFTRINSLADEQFYADLFRELLTDRNRVMVERMQPILDAGNAFIAIGAMHLPGADGVLSLLAREGYRISAVY
ncbi:MAG: TraB/GumN family protein, partial [Gammaproteobacteria bacterium]